MEITIKTPNQGESILGLVEMPGRKRKALYRMHGRQIIPVAYFQSDEDAAWVEAFLRDLTTRAMK